jgi:hypothetical protein
MRLPEQPKPLREEAVLQARLLGTQLQQAFYKELGLVLIQ